ncbi:MAG: GAF domain-containing sensor histidine kinase [Chloroflexi bacterium]|nr:GAF domain-containing sensor histidine kinase [Chloroflexota bacterium]
MYQKIKRASIDQYKRLVTHAILDIKLNIIRYLPELVEWSCLEANELTEAHLFDLFPQLEQDHEHILESLQMEKGAFICHNVHFAQGNHPIHTYDIQIEPFLGLSDQFILSVIPLNSHLPAPTAVSANNKNLANLTQHNRDLRLLNRASQILTATLDSKEVLERLLQVTAQIINATGSSVWLWEDDAQEHLVCRAAFHPGKGEQIIGMRVASGDGIVGWVAESGQSTIVPDPATDGRFYSHIDASSGFVTTSILAVPIHFRNRILGVLEGVNKENGSFLPEDRSYAEMLAASAAIAIDNAHLIDVLQQKMEDLKLQNDELEAFDHTVAHNLQNPLALVVGFADLLQNNDITISQVEQDRALTLLVRNAQRMSNIIQELLMLSSVRKSDVETHPLDMNEIVLGALDRLRFMMQQYNVRIILPDSWEVALGYAPWIEEVWENYISNALKYGGEPPQIELGNTVLPNGRIQFWIRDNGQGISQEKQALLFTPFTQLSQVRVTGNGLGLSIARRIMEKLGGEVGVQSQPEQGSTFNFTLPSYSKPKE